MHNEGNCRKIINPIEREEQKGHSTKTQTMRSGELKEYAKMQ